MTYTLTTYGCREYLCRVGLIPGKLTFERVCIPVATIQARVSDHFNIPLAEMQSKRRAREVVRPRQVAMYLSKQLTRQSLPEIGRRFGGRDHTTVLHSIRTIEKLRAVDGDLNAAVTTLQSSLEAA